MTKRLNVGDQLVAEGSWNTAIGVVTSVTDTEAIVRANMYANDLLFDRDFTDMDQAKNVRATGSMGDNCYWQYVPTPLP